jgi:hypothetical protein
MSKVPEKKVFFLNPPPVLFEIVDELARREFEVYLVRDHVRLKRILELDPEALVFINIDDEKLDEMGWIQYIDELQNKPGTAGVRIGIITLNDRPPEVKHDYFINHHVACGFIVLNIGAAKTTEILVTTLEINEARGQRRFVRAACPPGSGTCVFEFEGALLKAEIIDLSSAGMAIRLEGGISIATGTVLRKMTLTVKTIRISPFGVVVGMRADARNGNIQLIMFSPGSLDDARREKLKTLVRHLNQDAMDEALARLTRDDGGACSRNGALS